MKELLVACVLLTALDVANRADAADLSLPLPVKAPTTPFGYDWSGFYAGGRVGYAWGTSNWTASTPGAPNALARSTCFSPLTPSRTRAASPRDCKPATIICCPTAS